MTGRVRRVASAAAIAAVLAGGVGVTRTGGLRARFGAALRAFADPALLTPQKPLTVECGAIGPTRDQSALLEAAIARDFQKPTSEDLDDPGGATLASLTLPDLKVPITRRTMRFVRFFARSSSGRAAFTERFKRGGRYRPLIEHALREAGLPEDLVWLAAIESGFNPQAVSPAGASGLFQFMPQTGAVYGLYVSPFVDERRSISRSTDAAVAHLRDLYERFRRWDLALAAYNLGYDGVVRAMDRATELRRVAREAPRPIEFADLAEARLVPDETANYVPQITAFAIVAANRGRFGLDNEATEPALELAEIPVPEGARIRTIARAAGVPTEVLRDLNPQLLRDRVPTTGGDYLVEVPADRVQHALATLPAYLDHETLDADDGDVAANIEAPSLASADDDPLPRRPIALGKNRLPAFDLPGAMSTRASVGDLAVLGAKLPLVMIGVGVGWQRPGGEDPFEFLSGARGQANGKGRDAAIDKQLAFLGPERGAAAIAMDPFERFSLPSGIAVELRRDSEAAFVAITARIDVGDSHDPKSHDAGVSMGEARHTLTVTPRDLDVGLEMAIARLRILAASSGDASLEMIRRRATAPRRKALEARPYGAAWVALGDALFPEGHPLAGTTFGARNDPSIARDLLLADALRSERATLRSTITLVGNVERARAEGLLNAMPIGTLANEAAPIAAHPREDRLTIEENVPTARVLYGWIAPGEADASDAVMRVAAEILCGPRSSRVEAALVSARLASEVHGMLDLGERASALAIEIIPAVSHDPSDVERALDAAIAGLGNDGPTWRELALAKALLKIRLEKERTSARGPVLPGAPLAASSARIRSALVPGEIDKLVTAIDAVTAPEVRAVVRRVLAPGHRVVVTTMPRGEARLATATTP